MHVGRYRGRRLDVCFARLSSYAKDVPATKTVETADLAASLRIGVARLSRRIRVERAGDDLTFNQLSVLGTLGRHGAMPVGEIAAHENVKPPSMTRTVASLEELGLVTRRPGESDGRQVVVELTDRARQVMDADRRRRDAWLARRLADLDPDDVATLHKAAPILEALAAS
jgi:DNA-binding MarR family transcriptional regulator